MDACVAALDRFVRGRPYANRAALAENMAKTRWRLSFVCWALYEKRSVRAPGASAGQPARDGLSDEVGPPPNQSRQFFSQKLGRGNAEDAPIPITAHERSRGLDSCRTTLPPFSRHRSCSRTFRCTWPSPSTRCPAEPGRRPREPRGLTHADSSEPEATKKEAELSPAKKWRKRKGRRRSSWCRRRCRGWILRGNEENWSGLPRSTGGKVSAAGASPVKRFEILPVA